VLQPKSFIFIINKNIIIKICISTLPLFKKVVQNFGSSLPLFKKVVQNFGSSLPLFKKVVQNFGSTFSKG